MKSQKDLVLGHLLKGSSITQREAIAFYNIIRLSSIIYLLKKEGYKFNCVDKKNYTGRGKYRKYSLKLKKLPDFI